MQEFREGDYYDSSAVAIGVVGRPSRARYLNESTAQLSAAPGKGRFTILISSAASFDRKQEWRRLSLKDLDAAAAKGFNGLLADTLLVARFLGQRLRPHAQQRQPGRFRRSRTTLISCT